MIDFFVFSFLFHLILKSRCHYVSFVLFSRSPLLRLYSFLYPKDEVKVLLEFLSVFFLLIFTNSYVFHRYAMIGSKGSPLIFCQSGSKERGILVGQQHFPALCASYIYRFCILIGLTDCLCLVCLAKEIYLILAL